MANHTWRQAVNEVQRLAGLGEIPDDATFDDDSLLDVQQKRCKYSLRLAHLHLTPKLQTDFVQRIFTLPIDSSSAIWPLDVGIHPGAIKFRTFMNVTPNNPNQAELLNWDYDEFERIYADQTLIYSGPPEKWILMPVDRSLVSPVYSVRIFPNPDSIYTLQYKARLNAYDLEQSTDVLLWPPEHEYTLWEWAWSMVERGLGEGKEGTIMQLAQEAFKHVQLEAGEPEDVRHAIRTMSPTVLRQMRNTTGIWRGYYNSPPG